MEMKITQHDKFLLSALACVLILVGFVWYLILPATEKADELNTQVETASQEKEEMQMRLTSYLETMSNYEEKSAQAKAAAADYYDLMTSQEVDRELTNIAVSNGLEVTDLNIQPLALAEVEPYVRSALARGEVLDQAVDSADAAASDGSSANTDTAASDSSSSTTGTTSSQSEAIAAVEAAGSSDSSAEETGTAAQDEIYVYQVAMTLDGTEEEYQKIIDLFNNKESYPAIRVTGLAYKDAEMTTVVNEDGSLEEVEGNRTLVLNLEMYMCDKATMGEEE